MTTIAYRNGILATDTQLTVGSTKQLCNKLHLVQNFECFSLCGNIDEEETFLLWYKSGAKWDERSEDKMKCEAIQVDKFGDAYWWWHYNRLPIVEKFFAIGSGGLAARMAMKCGMSAIEAVKAASELDVNTNNIVDYYSAKTGKIKRGV